MSGVYLTLPSDVQSDRDNTISHYRTHLAERLILPRENHEVALVQVSYVAAIQTFCNDEDTTIRIKRPYIPGDPMLARIPGLLPEVVE